MINSKEILETIRMIQDECLDIRTTTMGISLLDCGDTDIDKSCQKVYDKICTKAEHLVSTGEQIEKEYGIPIINKRVSVTPIAIMAGISGGDPVKYALALEKAAQTIGVNFIGGYSALVQKGFAAGDLELINSIPRALAETEHICSSVNIGSTKAGINMDAVKIMGQKVKEAAELTKDNDCIAAGKLVVFCNAPEDNPFMAGAFHGVSEPDCVINVGVSGPGVVRSAISKHPDYSVNEIAELIKKTAFKITRMGQLVGVEASRRLGVDFGIVDLSLAPTPAVGDSVAHILEEIGLEQCGGAGTLVALNELLNAGLSDDELCNIGVKIGADVPFCIKGGTLLAQGIGDVLNKVKPLRQCFIVIAKPDCGVNTGKAYAQFDTVGKRHTPDKFGMLCAMQNRELCEICSKMENVFEQFIEVPNKVDIKEVMRTNGALGVCMSGSGPTVFGIFDDKEKAEKSALELKTLAKDIAVTKPVNKGCKIIK